MCFEVRLRELAVIGNRLSKERIDGIVSLQILNTLRIIRRLWEKYCLFVPYQTHINSELGSHR